MHIDQWLQVVPPLAVYVLVDVVGAVIGDSIGYALGRRFGDRLFTSLGRKFPRHFGVDHVNYAEHVFGRWGALAVYFGRWVALLRIFAGPIASALRMRYPLFLVVNLLGGITWAVGTTAAIYYLGQAAETFLKQSSYVALGVAVLIGLTVGVVLKRRMNTLVERHAAKLRAERADEEPA